VDIADYVFNYSCKGTVEVHEKSIRIDLLCMKVTTFMLQESPTNAQVSAEQRKIPRKFELIAVQGHPRSSTFCQSKAHNATSYQSLVVTLVVSRTVFGISTHKTRN